MRRSAEFQAVKASAVFGIRHLASSVAFARRAHAEGANRARDLRTEFLLYLTGRRQVGDALQVAGLGRGVAEAVVVVFSSEPVLELMAAAQGWKREDSLIDARPRDLKAAGFTDREIKSALDPLLLPLERTALLAVQR